MRCWKKGRFYVYRKKNIKIILKGNFVMEFGFVCGGVLLDGMLILVVFKSVMMGCGMTCSAHVSSTVNKLCKLFVLFSH